ncbi:MAG: ABC transporter permease subunit [Pyrinomonadaceae bacterium]
MNVLRGLLGMRRPASLPGTLTFASKRGVTGRLLAQRSARAGIFIALLLFIVTFLIPFVWPYQPERMNVAEKLSSPSLAHPLGTDQYGRDQLARIMDGGRRSLGAALVVLSGVLVISLCVGVTVGVIGGVVDAVAMRLVDILLALPPLVLALAVVGVLGVGFKNLLLALVASSWAYYARLARSLVRLARKRQDVIADRLAGVGWTRITVGHIVPGVLAQLAIVATLDLGGIIIGVAGLSFLGLGVQPPDAEWGAMLSESRLFFTVAPWLLFAPAAAIFFSVVSANLIGNALRNAADYN